MRWNPRGPIRWFCLLVFSGIPISAGPEFDPEDLIAWWRLNGGFEDSSQSGLQGAWKGAIAWEESPSGIKKGAGVFDGIENFLEVPSDSLPNPATLEFTLAGWFRIPDSLLDAPGDFVSKYDADTRTGFHFGLQHGAGTTTSQSNTRNLYFGIDSGSADTNWTDRGRPGTNELVYALAVWDGALYAGTYEKGADKAGSVYCYQAPDQWIFCGSPDACNSVTSLCVFENQLYAGVGDYDAGGSKLERSENRNPGGKVYRYAGGTSWVDCGRVGEAPYIFGLVDFDRHLYATLIRAPNPSGDLANLGLYRYEGGQEWSYCGNPGGRACSLAPYNGKLYATGYDGGEFGGVFRYEGGAGWSNCGVPGKTTQTYSFAFLNGEMYVGTWPEGKVYRYEADNRWVDCGRLGEELEVMGMAIYNGQLFAGTLPLAQVYRFTGGDKWVLSGRLDWTADAAYRRAWSMAVFEGQLFCGVLPSGHVHSLEMGKMATFDGDLGVGWKHIAAVRERDRLALYLNGQRVSESTLFEPGTFDLTNSEPLKIGFGAKGHFKGGLSDLRMYRRALSRGEIRKLSDRPDPTGAASQ